MLVVVHGIAGGSICLGRCIMLGGESVAKACTARKSLYLSEVAELGSAGLGSRP